MSSINPYKVARPFEELFQPGCPWYEARETFGQPDIKWCERTQCSIVTEPANTWSNFSYLLIAFLILQSKPFRDKKQTWLFSLVVFVMGICSLIYHASNNALSQMLDFLGIFGFVFLVIFMNLKRLGAISQRWVYPLTFLMTFALPLSFVLLYRLQIHVQFTVGLAVILLFLTEGVLVLRKKKPRSYKPIFLSVIFFSIATFFTIADGTRLICEPDNHFIQAHALWHIFGAIGVYFAVRHAAIYENEF